jgi:glutamate-1-semialdehyde 2,1-aminomutase
VAFDVRPDLTSLAKIVAGGLPGAAVAGRKDILDLLDFAATAAAGREKVQHPGTFNANPVSAAAGIAALGVVAEEDVTGAADRAAETLRRVLNAVLEEERVPWAVYGTSSGFHFFLNPQKREILPSRFDPYACSFDELKTPPGKLGNRLRLALLAHGVDVNNRLGGFTSITHGAAEVADTAEALRGAVRMLREEGDLPA